MSESFTLKVLTLNIWGITFSREQNLRVRALCAALEDREEDILCFQEVWQAQDRDLIVRQARKYGYIYAAYFAAKGVGSGLLVLSIFPIVETDFKQFALRGRVDRIYYGDYIAGKGIGLARIKTPIGMIDVYNTHTIAQYHPDKNDIFRAHRRTQHYEICHFINQHTENNPVILMGDFNMRPDQPNHLLITTLGNVTDCYQALYPDDPGITLASDNPFHANDPDLRLDYVFVRNGHAQTIRPRTAEITLKYIPYTGKQLAYSDHYGVAVTLQIIESSAQPETATENHTQIGKVYDALATTLEAGIQDALIRQANAERRYHLSILLTLAGVFAGRILGKRLGMFATACAVFYMLICRRIAHKDLPQEVEGLKQFSLCIEKQKARS